VMYCDVMYCDVMYCDVLVVCIPRFEHMHTWSCIGSVFPLSPTVIIHGIVLPFEDKPLHLAFLEPRRSSVVLSVQLPVLGARLHVQHLVQQLLQKHTV